MVQGTQFIILVRHDGRSCHGLEQQDPESAGYSLSAARKERGLCRTGDKQELINPALTNLQPLAT